MSDADDPESERKAIREQKRERLKEQLGEGGEGDAPTDPIHVEGESHLEDLVEGHDVVLVDYYADWCGPCQQLEPVVESIATDSPATVAKVDVDAHESLARGANVRGVPTLVLYADGQQVERLEGMQGEGQLRSLIDRHAPN